METSGRVGGREGRRSDGCRVEANGNRVEGEVRASGCLQPSASQDRRMAGGPRRSCWSHSARSGGNSCAVGDGPALVWRLDRDGEPRLHEAGPTSRHRDVGFPRRNPQPVTLARSSSHSQQQPHSSSSWPPHCSRVDPAFRPDQPCKEVSTSSSSSVGERRIRGAGGD